MSSSVSDRLLAGRSAIVTGAASGIGRASALTFAREGAAVVVADVDVDGGHDTVDLVRSAGGEARFVRCDVSDAADVVALVATTVAAYGRLDCAHDNAGVPGPPAPMHQLGDDDFERVTAVLVRGTFLCLKHQIGQMLAQPPRPDGSRGAIVCTSSVAGSVTNPGRAAYVAGKHAINGLVKTAALEYVRDGIRVNAVAPGATLTGMMLHNAGSTPERLEAIAQAQPGGRIADPSEIAELAVWLCTDRSSFVTGQVVTADGGATLGGTVDARS